MTTLRRATLALVLLVVLVVVVIQYKSPSFFRDLLHRKEGVAVSTVKPSQQLLKQIQPVTPNHSDETIDPEIAQIDAYCKDLDAYQEKHAKEARLIASIDADDSDAKLPKPWKSYANSDDVQKLFDSGNAESYDQANVFLRNGHVVLVYAEYSDPTGDWINYATYYFSEDGKLKKISSQLNTFEGNMTVMRETYFSVTGKQLREDLLYFTLQDHKKLDKPTEDFVDFPVPKFLAVDVSPFRLEDQNSPRLMP